MNENAYLIVSGIAGIVGLPAVIMFSLFKLRIRSRLKGYVSPLTTVGAMIYGIATYFIGFFLFARNDRLVWTNSEIYNPAWAGESLANLVLYFGGTVALSMALAVLIVALLPPKSLRHSGDRVTHFPWTFAAKCLIGVGAILTILHFWLGWEGVNGLKVGLLVCLPAGLYCLSIGRRFKSASLTETVSADHRPPVLYLRAFARENKDFALLKLHEIATYAPLYQAYAARAGVNFEQYLGQAFSAAIGPFVALGSPEDYAPPEGAAGMYAPDASWKTEFRNLSHNAACIVMQADLSDNLGWELQSLRADRLQERLFILGRPSRKLGLVRDLIWKFIAYREKPKGRAAWQKFVQIMQSRGYVLDIVEPGPGAVIGFDSEGKGKLLATGVVEPMDFVVPIIRALERLPERADFTDHV